MTVFDGVRRIRAGNSSPAPARDYIFRAGGSNVAARDFLVKYVKYILDINASSINVSSPSLRAWDLPRIDIEIESGTASLKRTLERLILLGSALRVVSSLAVIRQIDVVPGAIQVRSGNVSFFDNPTSVIEVESSTLQAFRVNLGAGTIQVTSPAAPPRGAENLVIGVSSGTGRFLYAQRIWRIATHLLSVTGRIDAWRMPSVGIQCVSPAARLRYTFRVWDIQPHVIGVGSSATNIIPIDLENLTIGVVSPQADLGRVRSMEIAASAVAVVSSEAILRDSRIAAIPSTIEVGSGGAEFRFLPSGFLPSGAPSACEFTCSDYSITRTETMSGRAVRRMMASRPTNALLSLEYVNVTDAEAGLVADAFHRSYGTTYGFKLPPLITQGRSAELANYIRLFNSNMKWHFDAPPRIESVSRGRSSVRVQLKARTEVR